MLKFLWSHGPQRLKYILLTLALIAGLSRDWVMMIVNKAAASPVEKTITYWLPMFIVTFIIVIGSSFAYQVLTQAVTTYVINNVRLKLIGGLLKSQPSFIDRREHGALYHILTTDVNIVAGFTNTFLNMLPSFIFLSIAVPQVFFYSPVAGGFVILVMICGTLAYHVQQKKLARLNDDARALEVAYFERVSEMLKGFRELRLHDPRRQSFSGDLSNVLDRLRRVIIKATRVLETGESVVHALKFGLFAGVVFLVPYLVRTESVITFQVLNLILFSLLPFEQIVTSYPSVINTLISYMRISDLWRDLAVVESVVEHKVERAPAFRTIRLRGVETKYASRETSSFALGPLDFELRSGEVVFLVGSNGSGKTTFMNVLTGLLDPTAGTIELDGKVLAPEDMGAYRAQFSAIFTHFHVFRPLYGLESVTPEAADATVEKVRHRRGRRTLAALHDLARQARCGHCPAGYGRLSQGVWLRRLQAAELHSADEWSAFAQRHGPARQDDLAEREPAGCVGPHPLAARCQGLADAEGDGPRGDHGRHRQRDLDDGHPYGTRRLVRHADRGLRPRAQAVARHHRRYGLTGGPYRSRRGGAWAARRAPGLCGRG